MLGSCADPGPACAGTRASAAAAGTQAEAPEGDAGRAPAPVPPRPTAGHAQSPRGAAGPLRRARRPPAAPPGGRCALAGRRSLCAARVGAAERGCDGVSRPGPLAAPPPGCPGPASTPSEKKGGFAGRAGAGTPPRRALGPLRSVSLRAGRAMPPRARARSASLFWRRRARCAPCARFARRAPQTMKPCGRCRGRASPGDRAVRGATAGLGGCGPPSAPRDRRKGERTGVPGEVVPAPPRMTSDSG